MHPRFARRCEVRASGGSRIRAGSMANVTLKNIKKIYPNADTKKKKKKKEHTSDEPKANLQITDEGVVAVQEFSLDIADREFIVLVGPSGCGKSTFGRTLLQLYRQTDGKTMYYGASRDELAPEYIEKTIRHLPHGLHELAALEKKRDEMQKVYDAADEQKRLHMHNDLTAAKKAANDAYLNIVNVIGGRSGASTARSLKCR